MLTLSRRTIAVAAVASAILMGGASFLGANLGAQKITQPLADKVAISVSTTLPEERWSVYDLIPNSIIQRLVREAPFGGWSFLREAPLNRLTRGDYDQLPGSEEWAPQRELLLKIFHSGLSNPDQVLAFYYTKKPVALEAFKEYLEPEYQQQLLQRIRLARQAMSNALQHRELLKQFALARENFGPQYHELYEKMDQTFEGVYDGGYAALFAMRRFNEGGKPLLDAYIAVLDDAIKTMETAIK